MVEVLLRVGVWTSKDLAEALEIARSSKHVSAAGDLDS